jgi:putative Holliday junction resolvase
VPILEIKDFGDLKKQNKSLLGIDYGEKAIGVSICDRSWTIASPHKTIINKKFTPVANEMFQLIDERDIIGVIIGLPLSMDGTENAMCQTIRQWGRNLMKIKDINIAFFDERFSTALAEQSLNHSDLSWDRKRELVDKVAAGHILQRFIDNM